MTEKTHENTYSKEFKRLKFMNSPSALVIFVGKNELVKSVRIEMSKKFGKLEKN